ncbi:MAG TPA: Type 1 glutamine amidotransferase-like domain-containing protein [Oscillospiraceae bacterium]|nr:Type 1 glutamine amidotransferase-like domain-containing protein [Oscillospiraceae bacterium]HPK36042.1 Type 1 glutamine amidotransferase-like domain-containing protein [Oscillospiraceae bacterium]HPR75973.1 Type 1 glutamine amidotransferase-like domain-containing protein [Oscillospiraceae bacterium]
MKKLFLSSLFTNVANLFVTYASCDLKGKQVTFIPTAAKHEKVDFFVKSGKKALEKAGLVVDELDISTATSSEISCKLQKTDFIYISGGNTFFLLQELKRSGADKMIREQVESGKFYIGESAGIIILSPNIEYVTQMDNPKAALNLLTFDALNLIPFYPLPHRNSFPFKKTVEKIIAKYESDLPLIPISNSQAIFVEDDSVKIVFQRIG